MQVSTIQKRNNTSISDKPGAPGAGESVSSVLPAGTYTLTVSDKTDYASQTLLNADEASQLLVNANVGMNIKTYRTQKIEGQISIPESGETMPVSMGVAAFDAQNERETDLLKIPQLVPTKPVWVVVHGMNGHEDAGGIESVARELGAYGEKTGQVVTINWETAAQDITRTGQDAPWTKAVGEWVGRQLVAAGFDPEMMHFVGHSHGTYASFSAANEIMRIKDGRQVNTIVALDPAGNVRALSGFDDDQIRFDAVSRNSVAIEGSWISGSNRLASTADVAFQIESADTSVPWKEHGLPVTTFANILRSERLMPGQLPHILSLDALMTPLDQQDMLPERDAFRDIFEGIITIGTRQISDKYGQYLEALLSRVEWRIPDKDVNEIRDILNVDTMLVQP